MIIEIHDRSQWPLLLEHFERSRPDPLSSSLSPLLGAPIYFEDSVPKGVMRVTSDDGTVHDWRMA